MKVEVNDAGHIVLTLSRRNLEALLLKLDEPASMRTLIREDEDGHVFIVKAENNETHYQGRVPGIMHPREEARLTRS